MDIDYVGLENLTMDKQTITIRHAVPGRMRLSFSKTGHEDTPDLYDLLSIHGIEEVVFCKITRSLLILYDENLSSEKAVLSGVKARLPHVILQKRQETGQASLLSKGVVGITRKVNRGISSTTKGHLNIMSLAPSALLLLGVRELLRNPVITPKWYDFFWWATNIFYWDSKNVGQNNMIPMEGGMRGTEAE